MLTRQNLLTYKPIHIYNKFHSEKKHKGERDCTIFSSNYGKDREKKYELYFGTKGHHQEKR